MTAPAPSLSVALWAATTSADVDDNARRIEAAITDAARAGARVLLTPECALSGYPGATRPDLATVDPCQLADREDRLALRAEQVGIALLLGSAAPNGSGGWTNDCLVAGAGISPQRYRKRALTPLDDQHFTSASSPLAVTIDGWRCAVSICFDVRFPSLWSAQLATGVDAFLTIAHMAGPDPHPPTKSLAVPAHYASRAAENATPIALCNTAAADRWLPSGAWDARGTLLAARSEGLLRIDLPHRHSHGDWYGTIRERAEIHARPPS
jgi:omega-amidase